MKKRDDSLLIYSGGMDSTVLLFDKNPKYIVCFKYHAINNNRELTTAKYFLNKWHNRNTNGYEIIEIPFFSFAKDYPMFQNASAIPENTTRHSELKKCYIPFRNGIFIAIATAIAEALKIKKVLLGVQTMEQDVYPDARPEFIKNFNKTTMVGTKYGVKIVAPYANKSKRSIAKLGKKILGEKELAISYSCLKGKRLHCGVCPSCLDRKWAMKGFDLTEYKC